MLIVKTYIIILFLIYSSLIVSADDPYNVIFNNDVIIENNLIVNNIKSDQPINVTGNILDISGQVTISGNSNVTLTASPAIYLNNLASKELVYYLVLDNNNTLGYTTQSPKDNFINNVNTNTIESESHHDLVIGNTDNDQVNINSQTVQFSENLNCDTISFNQPVEINTEIHFLNPITVNENITVTGGNIILEKKNENSIAINCNQFNTSLRINSYGNITLGNSDLSSVITINNLLGDITIGSQEHPITILSGLQETDTPIYYLVADNSGTVKKYDAQRPYIISQDSYTTDTISVNTIESANKINFNTYLLSITTDNLTIDCTPEEASFPKIIINTQECFAETLTNLEAIFINDAEIQPNLLFKINYLILFSRKLPDLTSSTFSFSHYYLKNIPVINPLNANPLTIELSTGQLTLQKINNTVKYRNTEKNLNPVEFNYKDNYNMKNNDICYKSHLKIKHFGFIAEEMEALEIEDLIIKDSNNKTIDYNNDVLEAIIIEKINLYRQYYQKILEKCEILQVKLEKTQHENTILKNIITQKKKLIRLLQTISHT